MDRRRFNHLLGSLAVVPALPGLRPTAAAAALREGVPTAPGRRWSLTADVAECCSCRIPCSCNFGRPVETCHGTRLIALTGGDYEGRPLEGIRFVVTFHMGNWTRVYVDEALSEAQRATFEAVFPIAFAGFERIARSIESVPLSVTSTGDTFRFSVPASTVEMRLLPGLGGEPIVITGLPSPAFHDYVQYESVVHAHEGPDLSWNYAGTNGFRSEMRAGG